MIEVGRLCIKIAGRDAGKKCVVVDMLDSNTAVIDGQTRRRKCNIKHLEPLEMMIKVRKGASRADVAKEFKKLKLDMRETKPKKAGERPRKHRRGKSSAEEPKAGPDKEAGKTEKKEEKKEQKSEPAKKEKKPTKK